MTNVTHTYEYYSHENGASTDMCIPSSSAVQAGSEERCIDGTIGVNADYIGFLGGSHCANEAMADLWHEAMSLWFI
jgi:hypothetical protein